MPYTTQRPLSHPLLTNAYAEPYYWLLIKYFCFQGDSVVWGVQAGHQLPDHSERHARAEAGAGGGCHQQAAGKCMWGITTPLPGGLVIEMCECDSLRIGTVLMGTHGKEQ